MAKSWKCECGHTNKLTANFCPACGKHWQGQSSYTPAKAPPPAWDGSRAQDLAWSAGAWSAPRRPWSPRRKSEKGKGKGGKPDRESSQGRAPHGPAPPKAAQLPKTPVPGPSSAGKEAMASAGSSSSVEKAALDKILLAMKENESDLTPQLRDLLAQHQQVDAREEAKVMHRVVASKAAAKGAAQTPGGEMQLCASMERLPGPDPHHSAKSGGGAHSYHGGVCDKGGTMGASLAGGCLSSHSHGHRWAAGHLRRGRGEGHRAHGVMEARTDEAAASEAQAQKVVEQVTAKGAELVEALSKVRGQALEEATKEQGRERTPRRKAAQEGTLPPGKAS